MNTLINILGVVILLSLSACSMHDRRAHFSSSVYEYLYPDQEGRIDSPGIPTLSLPLRVGIAFVPDNTRTNYRFSEKNRMDLMNEVARHFKQHDYVKEIELIPSAYLTPKGGFTNLDQIGTMYHLDVIALLSYDQTQFTAEGVASFAYWTIIGAYIVPGEKNDTHTMVDAAVYDIRSRKMLFRAPGVSHIKGLATPVNLQEALTKNSIAGFQQASTNLIENLDRQLELFKERAKAAPEEYKIVRKAGYTGGGFIDGWYLLFFLLMGCLGLYATRRKTDES